MKFYLFGRIKNDGFTLLELMIVIAILAIMASFAYPSFTSAIQSNRIKTEANNFASDLFLMRGETMKRGVAVSMCASSDGATCTGSSWTAGRIIFSDKNGDGALTNPDDVVLQVRPAVAGTTTL